MAFIMTASEFVKKLENIAKNYKTLYVMGCFGAPMTTANKKRYCAHTEYNQNPTRQKMINAATTDTFGFDCVNLLKGVLWGWTGDKNKTYGGAKYAVNGVPDVGADKMITLCTGVSTDFNKIEVGEAVWCKGHIGVYIGNGLAVECTPAWKNKVQITAVSNIGAKTGYNARKWTKHGKLPWVDYTVVTNKTTTTKKSTTTTKEVKASESADKYDKSLTGTYVTTGNLNMRDDAGVTKKSLCVIPKGTKVKCYGYYSVSKGVKWYYIQATVNGVKYTGFSSCQYLKKV